MWGLLDKKLKDINFQRTCHCSYSMLLKFESNSWHSPYKNNWSDNKSLFLGYEKFLEIQSKVESKHKVWVNLYSRLSKEKGWVLVDCQSVCSFGISHCNDLKHIFSIDTDARDVCARHWGGFSSWEKNWLKFGPLLIRLIKFDKYYALPDNPLKISRQILAVFVV